MEWIPVLVVVLALVVFYFIGQKKQSTGVTNEFFDATQCAVAR